MTASPPFLGFPDRLADGRMPRAVIFGAGLGSTYPGKDSSGCSREIVDQAERDGVGTVTPCIKALTANG